MDINIMRIRTDKRDVNLIMGETDINISGDSINITFSDKAGE